MTRDKAYATPKVGNLGKIHGGKSYLARRLLELYPPLSKIGGHVEEYGGLASVMLNLKPATRDQPRWEVYNDIDGRLVNLFRMLRERPKQLQTRLNLTPYSEEEFERATSSTVWAAAWRDPLERARLMYVLLQMSWGGQGASWSWTKDRTRRGIADVVSGHLNAIDNNLVAIIARVREWQIDQLPGLECFQKYDAPHCFHYLDPPYMSATRAAGSREVYNHEMTDEEHETLLKGITAAKGMVMISGYNSDMYNDYLKTWRKVEIRIALHAAGGKQKRRVKECIWMNYK